jgi:hypothetical protein
MGIPARLVVGLLGSRGRVQAGLHAWSEYFADGWRIADASAGPDGTALAAADTEDPFRASDNAPAAPWPRPWPAIPGSAALVVAALAILALVPALIFSLKKNHSRRLAARTALNAQTSKEFLMPVIQQALLQPRVWGRQSPLWNHRFLPTVSGKPMAISRAFALLRRGRLMITTSQNQLTAAMGRSGRWILDLSQDFFAPLLDFLGGAVNLDILCRLQPQPPSRSRHQADRLLQAVNRRLKNKLGEPTACFLSPGWRETEFFNVSLPATPKQGSFFFPRRFIAVNPSGKRLAECAVLYEKNRPLAVFRFLQALNSEALLPAADPEAFLKKIARRLLRENP